MADVTRRIRLPYPSAADGPFWSTRGVNRALDWLDAASDAVLRLSADATLANATLAGTGRAVLWTGAAGRLDVAVPLAFLVVGNRGTGPLAVVDLAGAVSVVAPGQDACLAFDEGVHAGRPAIPALARRRRFPGAVPARPFTTGIYTTPVEGPVTDGRYLLVPGDAVQFYIAGPAPVGSVQRLLVDLPIGKSGGGIGLGWPGTVAEVVIHLADWLSTADPDLGDRPQFRMQILQETPDRIRVLMGT